MTSPSLHPWCFLPLNDLPPVQFAPLASFLCQRLASWLPFAEMNLFFFSPGGFKGKRFHYWTYYIFFQGSEPNGLPSTGPVDLLKHAPARAFAPWAPSWRGVKSAIGAGVGLFLTLIAFQGSEGRALGVRAPARCLLNPWFFLLGGVVPPLLKPFLWGGGFPLSRKRSWYPCCKLSTGPSWVSGSRDGCGSKSMGSHFGGRCTAHFGLF